MTLVQKIKALCDENGTNFAALERKLDFGQGSIRKWDNATPAGDRLAKVADNFGVSVDYLLGREETVRVIDEDNNIVVLDNETRDLIDSLRKNPEMKMLFSVSRNATKEDIIKTVKIIEALKEGE